MSVVMGNLAVFSGVPPFFAIAICLFGGVGAGLMNGWFITRIKPLSFITTLRTWSIIYALLLWLSGAQSIRGQDIDAEAPFLEFFGASFDIPGARIILSSVLMIVVFVALWYMLSKTAWGRHFYAIGDDKEAADLSGVRTDRMLLSVYGLSGFICALVGWASIDRVGSISPQSFYEENLDSITVVVIGGISLFGALIMGVFRSGLRLSGVDMLWQVFAIGWLIIAVAIDQWIRRVSA